MDNDIKSMIALILAISIFMATLAIGIGVGEYISGATARTCIEAGGYWDDNTCTIPRE